jgi:hypothetical protein
MELSDYGLRTANAATAGQESWGSDELALDDLAEVKLMGFWRYEDSARLTQAVEALAEDAEPDPFQRVIGGVILAAVVAVAGLAHFVAVAGWPVFAWLFDVWHFRRPISLVGVGVLLCGVALFLHAHHFLDAAPAMARRRQDRQVFGRDSDRRLPDGFRDRSVCQVGLTAGGDRRRHKLCW